MSGTIDCGYLSGGYGVQPGKRTEQSAAAKTSSFQEMAVQASRKKTDALPAARAGLQVCRGRLPA